jgi:hypothetical protein
VTASESQELVAATTFGEVDGNRPFRTQPGLGRDAEAKCRGNGTNDVNERV